MPTAPPTAPKSEDVSDEAGVQKLREVIDRIGSAKRLRKRCHPTMALS
jgi:hypothetical protein